MIRLNEKPFIFIKKGMVIRLNYLEWAKEFFSNDKFATVSTGIDIIDVRPGYSVCKLTVGENHLNAGGYVMGGAIFTLADFAFAVASNCDGRSTVSLTSSITYLNAAERNSELIAEAKCIKSGKSTCSYIIEITDGNSHAIASVATTGSHKNK